MGERLKLVTSFSELRAGDLVVVRPCGHCGKTHRGLVGNLDSSPGLTPDGAITTAPNWEILGESHVAPVCHPTRLWPVCFGPGAVRSREVYKIDTGLSLDTTEETSRPLEVVRG